MSQNTGSLLGGTAVISFEGLKQKIQLQLRAMIMGGTAVISFEGLKLIDLFPVNQVEGGRHGRHFL